MGKDHSFIPLGIQPYFSVQKNLPCKPLLIPHFALKSENFGTWNQKLDSLVTLNLQVSLIKIQSKAIQVLSHLYPLARFFGSDLL
jgi:hypothetical protein